MLNINQNPVTVRLLGKDYWAAWRLSVIVAFVVIVFSIIIDLPVLWQGSLNFPGPIVLMLVTIGVYVAAPLIVSAFFAQYVTTELALEAFVLLCASPMPNKDFVAGFIIAGLHRLRWLFAIVVGIFPLLPLGALYVTQNIKLLPFSMTYEILPVGIGGWSMNCFALIVSLIISLRVRKSASSIFLSTVVTLLIGAGYLWILLYCFAERQWLINIFLATVPVAISIGLIRFADRWVRSA